MKACNYLFALTLALATLLSAGCASLGNHESALDTSLRAYESALRWQRYDVALSLHADPSQVPMPTHLAAIRVTGFDGGPPVFSADGLHAERSVSIRYFHVDYQSERTLADRQQWVYDKDTGQWRITSPFPAFPYE